MASAADYDLELQENAPLLESRGRDNSWRFWKHLPRRDTSLAAFLVKSADVLANGILSLNVLNAIKFLGTVPKKEEERLVICFASTAPNAWKVFFLAVPFIIYPFSLWLNGVAKMAETDHRGLSVVSCAVMMEFIWVILVSGLLTHCISEASYGWVMSGVAISILLLLVIWTITFNRPRCLRMFCCSPCWCGLAPDIAAAEANDQSIVAAEFARQVAVAQQAFAAQVVLQNDAFAARERVREADGANRVAAEEVAKALQDAEVAASAKRVCEDEMNTKVEAKNEFERMNPDIAPLAPASAEQVAEASAQQASTEVEETTSTPADEDANLLARQIYSGIVKEATDATKKYEAARREHDTPSDPYYLTLLYLNMDVSRTKA